MNRSHRTFICPHGETIVYGTNPHLYCTLCKQEIPAFEEIKKQEDIINKKWTKKN